MSVVCFFPISDGLGVILDLERVEEIERTLRGKNLQVDYGFDFEKKTSYVKVGDFTIDLPHFLMEGIYHYPRLYVYVKRNEIFATYAGKIDLDPIKIIQLDSIGRTSSEFFNFFGPIINSYYAQHTQVIQQNAQKEVEKGEGEYQGKQELSQSDQKDQQEGEVVKF